MPAGGEPGKNALVALVDAAILLPQRQPGDELLDELALAGCIEGRGDLGIIVDSHGDQRQVAAAAVGSQRGEVGQAGQRIDQALGARAHHRQPRPDDPQQEQAGRDVQRDQIGFGQQRRGEDKDGRGLHDPLASAAQHESRGAGGKQESRDPAEVDRISLLQRLGRE